MKCKSIVASALLLWASAAGAESPTKDGAAIYQGSCMACHAAGVLGAPKLDVPEQWSKRQAQPLETLYSHALKGFNAMPAKGGNSSLSDDEVKRAVDHMLATVRQAASAPPPEPQPAVVTEGGASATPQAETTGTPPSGDPAATSPTVALLDHLKGGESYHVPPALEAIPHDKYGDEVRLGHKIFTETWRYARRYAGNDLTCANCHLDAGRKANSAPMWAAFGMYPTYRRKNDRNVTLEERIQDCFRFSMNGFAPALDAPEIRALTSYFHYLAKGAPVGTEMPGRGFPQVVATGQDPNPTRGGQVFKAKCAVCHGEDGSGKRVEGQKEGWQFPPLWGSESFNKGAGLHQVQTMAGFIKANMPLGQDFSLTDQEALDVAAFINLQLRPWDPRKGMLKGLFE